MESIKDFSYYLLKKTIGFIISNYTGLSNENINFTSILDNDCLNIKLDLLQIKNLKFSKFVLNGILQNNCIKLDLYSDSVIKLDNITVTLDKISTNQYKIDNQSKIFISKYLNKYLTNFKLIIDTITLRIPYLNIITNLTEMYIEKFQDYYYISVKKINIILDASINLILKINDISVKFFFKDNYPEFNIGKINININKHFTDINDLNKLLDFNQDNDTDLRFNLKVNKITINDNYFKLCYHFYNLNITNCIINIEYCYIIKIQKILELYGIKYQHLKLSITKCNICLNSCLLSLLIDFNIYLKQFSITTQKNFNQLGNKIINNILFYENYNNKIITNHDFKLNIIDNYFYNQVQQILNKYIKLKKINILIYNKNNTLINRIKIQELNIISKQNNIFIFSIHTILITDNTNSFWNNLLFKLNNKDFVLLRIHKFKLDNYNTWCYNIDLANYVINIDEIFIKQITDIIYLFLAPVTEIFQKINLDKLNNSLDMININFNNFQFMISYKPRGLNLSKLIMGHNEELLRLGTIRDLTLKINKFTIKNTFSLPEIFIKVITELEKQITKQHTVLIGHIGILKLIISPTLKCQDFIYSKKPLLNKCKDVIKGISSDIIEIATRSTVGLETFYDNISGKINNQSKYSNSPQNMRESYRLLRNKKKMNISQYVTIGLLGIQSSINPKQAFLNKMKYDKT